MKSETNGTLLERLRRMQFPLLAFGLLTISILGLWELIHTDQMYSARVVRLLVLFFALALLAITVLLTEFLTTRRLLADASLSTARLEMVMASGKSVGWEWDVASGLGYWFGDLRTVLGIPSDTWSGPIEESSRYIHPEDRQRVSQAVTHARLNHKRYEVEFRVVRQDGDVRWLAATGLFYYTKSSQPERMLGMAVDITERKQAEEQLKKSEEKFSKAFRQNPIILTLTSAIDHRYIDVNEGFEQVTGWRRDEVVGRTPFDIQLFPNPQDRIDAVQRLLRAEGPRNLELRYRMKDGSERFGLVSAELIEIENETCVLAVAVDITQQKQIQEKLRESEERLSGVIESAMDAIIAIDEQQRIVLFNPAAERMFGCTAEKALQTTIDRFIPEQFRAEHAVHIRRFAESGVTSRGKGPLGTLWGLRTNGEIFPMEASISQANAQNGKLFTVIIRDLTERRRIEEAQRRNDERLRLAVQAGRMYADEWDAASESFIRSPECVEILGNDQAIKTTRHELLARVYPDDRPQFESFYASFTPEKPTSQVSYRFRRADGTLIWLEKRARAFFDDKGNLLRAISVVADVTDRKKAEEELHAIEERFRRVVEHIGDAVIVDDPAGHVVFANENFLSMFGFDRDQLPTLTLEDYVAPEFHAQLRDRHDRRMRGEHLATHFEYEGLRRDGRRMWLEVDVTPIIDQGGKVAGTQSAIRDITERKRAEQQLQESEQRFRHLIDASNDWVWEVDAEGVYTYAGPQCRQTLGYEPEELIGKTPFDLMPPDESRRIAAIFGAIAAERKAFRALENINMHKDGHLVVLETNGIPVVDNDGRFCGYRGMDRDITERKRAEQALRESEQRFRLVANTAPVMIWMSNKDRLCTYLNQQWLDFTGRPLEAELGNGWEEDIYPDDLRACLDTYKQAFDKREVFDIRYRLRRRDGEYRWIRDKGVPRFEADGSFAGYIGSCHDITDRERASEILASLGRRLIQAHEQERTWIARELHDDINQRVALLAVELEQWKQHVPASTVDFGFHIEHARERLFDISKDVQALSHRLHSSKLEYLGIVTATKSFCREISDLHKVRVAFTHSGVPRNLPSEVSLVLFRVLQEALQNAVKHSHAQDFSVALRGTPGEVCLTVSDPGTGFDQSEAMGSRGLGLISMRERLQLVNGIFAVESSPGHGATIRARVPIKADMESPEARQMTG